MKRIGVILSALLVLAACGSDPEPAAQGDGTVSGAVLEGSISDEMLPIDSVQSQSPPIEKAPASSDSAESSTAEVGGNAAEPKPDSEAEETAPEE